MFIANTTCANIIATRYAQLNTDGFESDNSKITHDLRNVKNDNEAVLKNHNFFDKIKTFSKRIFNNIKKVVCLRCYDGKNSKVGATRINDINLNGNPVENKLMTLKLLVEQLSSDKASLKKEGLFRVPGGKNEIDNILGSTDKPCQGLNVSPETNIHAITGAIKQMIEESLSQEDKRNLLLFKEAFIKQGNTKSPKLPSIEDLPEALRIILPLMKEVIAVSGENRMDAHNLATMISPRFYPDSVEKFAGKGDYAAFMTKQVTKSNENSAFIEALLQKYCQNKEEKGSHESAA